MVPSEAVGSFVSQLGLAGLELEGARLAILLLGMLLLLQTLRLWWVSRAGARSVKRNQRRGARAEAQAAQFLKKQGYRVSGAGVSGSYQLKVDGQQKRVHLLADYVVERRGARFVAEVKSTEHAASLSVRATRRQMLEYLYAFDVAGVLLVDMYRRRIVIVEFPKVQARSE